MASFFSVGYHYSVPLDKWNISDIACDYIKLGDHIADFEIPGTLGLIYNYKTWCQVKNKDRTYPLLKAAEYLEGVEVSQSINFIGAQLADITDELLTVRALPE